MRNYCIINIGTDKKNYAGIALRKPFDEVNYEQIIITLKRLTGTDGPFIVHGWADVTDSYLKYKPNKK